MALVNSNNEKLGKWITNKTTKIFLSWEYGGLLNCLHLANKLSKDTRSYSYPVFKRRSHKLEHVGYGVPK